MIQVNNTSYAYYRQIDGLRFFSVLGILCFHWLHIPIINAYSLIVSNISIDFYFVISGFLITKILLLLRQKVEEGSTSRYNAIRNFYIRRSLRIFPIYYLFILVGYLINLVPIRDIYPWLITYSTNFLMLDKVPMGPFSHLWTLAIEEQFYLAFPLFILWLPKQLIKNFLLAGVVFAIISRAIMLYYFTAPIAAYLIPFCCADALCIGALMAHQLHHKNSLNTMLKRKYLLVLSIIIFFVCCYRFVFINKEDAPAFILFRLSISLCCAWIVGMGVQNDYKGMLGKIIENNVIVYLGKICYGIYLYHLAASYITTFLLSRLPSYHFQPHIENIGKAGINFIITITLASVSWQLIEKPINNFKKNF